MNLKRVNSLPADKIYEALAGKVGTRDISACSSMRRVRLLKTVDSALRRLSAGRDDFSEYVNKCLIAHIIERGGFSADEIVSVGGAIAAKAEREAMCAQWDRSHAEAVERERREAEEARQKRERAWQELLAELGENSAQAAARRKDEESKTAELRHEQESRALAAFV